MGPGHAYTDEQTAKIAPQHCQQSCYHEPLTLKLPANLHHSQMKPADTSLKVNTSYLRQELAPRPGAPLAKGRLALGEA